MSYVKRALGHCVKMSFFSHPTLRLMILQRSIFSLLLSASLFNELPFVSLAPEIRLLSLVVLDHYCNFFCFSITTSLSSCLFLVPPTTVFFTGYLIITLHFLALLNIFLVLFTALRYSSRLTRLRHSFLFNTIIEKFRRRQTLVPNCSTPQMILNRVKLY